MGASQNMVADTVSGQRQPLDSVVPLLSKRDQPCRTE